MRCSHGSQVLDMKVRTQNEDSHVFAMHSAKLCLTKIGQVTDTVIHVSRRVGLGTHATSHCRPRVVGVVRNPLGGEFVFESDTSNVQVRVARSVKGEFVFDLVGQHWTRPDVLDSCRESRRNCTFIWRSYQECAHLHGVSKLDQLELFHRPG